MQVRILAKTKRAKDRVREHGQVMELKEIRGDKFLVKSLTKSWRGEEWLGWFETDVEASFKEIKVAVKSEVKV